MSKIEELLKNEKVEWKRLDEIFYIRTGYTPSKNIKEYWENGEIDWFTIEDIRNRGRILEYANVKISKKGVKKDTFKKNSIILSIIATIGEHALIKTNFVVNQQFMVFTTKEEYDTKVNMNFMNYYFSKVSEYCKKNKRVGNVPTVDTQKILRLEIPIPSIETQEKIVKTLDKFTNYVTELQSELQSRTKQYEYYRDMLLSEEYLNKISAKINGLVSKDYELKLTTLGEIGEIQMCKRILKEQTSSQGEVPFYKIGTFGKEADSFISQDLFREYREKYNYPKNGEILLSASGTIGKTVIFDGEDSYFQDSNIVWISHNERLVLNKYLYYFYQIVKWNPSTGGTINRLYNYNLKNIKITLPPIEIQNKVVEILDKFQSLLADTKGLLPQEIEQRQKQYEYYREKLLTFDENSAKHTHTHTQSNF